MTTRLAVRDSTEVTIQGTLETVRGVAYIANPRMENGKIAFDYEGGTKIWWDEQETVKEDGQRMFVDAEGNEYTEDELVVIEEGA